MGVFQFFSTLALGTLAISSSFNLVAARPHRQGQQHHHHSGVGDVTEDPNVYVTTIYTTVHTTVHTRFNPTFESQIPQQSQIPNSFSQIQYSSRPVNSALNSTVPRSTKVRPTFTKSTFATLTTSPTSAEPAPSATGGAYSLVKSYCSGSFFDQFDFFTGSDPTHGFVEYVDRTTAESANLISQDNGTVYITPDFKEIAPSGRKSIRLESKDTFTEVLIIADFAHLPQAVCGTWPAFWTTNLNNWPAGGEIDIVEGVNNNAVNHVALHSSPGVVVQGAGTATFDQTNCDSSINGNAGCGGYSPSTTSYGDSFNNAGGGVYAMDWRSDGIKVWMFNRAQIPADITSGNPNTDNWGTPEFIFAGPNSNIASHFSDHKIIFDMTFCGDWAGAVFGQCGCSGTCTDFVANNPSAFAETFWSINSLNVYKLN